MLNRPAVILILLAVVAVVFFQFLIAVRTESNPPPVPTARPEPAAESEPNRESDYGDLTPEEFYARQDAADLENEISEANRGRVEEPEPLPGTDIPADALPPPGEPTPDEDPIEAIEEEQEEAPAETEEAPEQTEEAPAETQELTEEEQATQEAVEEILNRE